MDIGKLHVTACNVCQAKNADMVGGNIRYQIICLSKDKYCHNIEDIKCGPVNQNYVVSLVTEMQLSFCAIYSVTHPLWYGMCYYTIQSGQKKLFCAINSVTHKLFGYTIIHVHHDIN